MDEELNTKKPKKQQKVKEILESHYNGDESKRQTVFKLADEGKDRDGIYDLTGFKKDLINTYYTNWMDRKLSKLKKVLTGTDWRHIPSILQAYKDGKRLMMENGYLYYPGRDPAAYFFMATTFLLIIILTFLLII